MPCSKCESPFLVSEEYEDMRCPNCLDIPVVQSEQLEPLTDEVRELFSEKRVFNLYKQYSKSHLILALIRTANKAGHDIFTSRKGSVRDLSIASRLVKRLYPETGFGDDQMDFSNGVPERFETFLGHQHILRKLDHLESKFEYAYPDTNTELKPTTKFFEQFRRYQSELEYCYVRCAKSLHGGFEDNQRLFDEASDRIRDFDKPSVSDINSSLDFANVFFEFIISMAFLYSADDSLNNVYAHSFHDELTIDKLTHLTERLDGQFSNRTRAHIDQSGELSMVDWIELQQIGWDIFGPEWSDIQNQIVMHSSNPDAHPFLFGITVDEPAPGHRPGIPVYLQMPKVVYPRHYSKLIRMQMFPMLKTENGTSGHRILDDVCTERGPVFERNLHEYLISKGHESYHSAEATKANQNEVDVLVVNEEEGEIWFVECKYLLPPLRMDTPNGIEKMNEKFDRRVFPSSSIAFDDKADWWMEQMPGKDFTSQIGQDENDRESQRFRSEWTDYDVQRFVVSNLVPSYTLKRNVLFFTDLEFIKYLETGETPYLPKRNHE